MEKGNIIRSLLYKFTERFAVKGIGMVISIVLARLLSPEIVGQVAILEIFISFSLIIIESGVNSSLIQSRTADERDYATVFYLTLAIACAAILLLELTAPLIAAYYKSPQLTVPLRICAFVLLFSSFNSIQVARMQREMRFREMMWCNLSASLLAGGFGILLALRGAGLWALVAYHFGHIIVVCLLQFLVLRWVPKGRFSLESARRLGGYGVKMLAASFISTLYTSLRPLIIGRRFSTAELGYYDRGQKFASTISLNLDSAVQSVMFPVLSRAQDDAEQFRAILRRMKGLGSFLIFPVMLGLAAVAEPLIVLLLKEQWLPTVPFLVLLSIGEAQVPLTSSNLVALKSLGRSDLYARQELVRRVLMIAVLAVSVFAFDSVEAIAVSFVISAWLDVWVTGLPIRKLVGYGFFDQLRDVWKSGLSALVMAGAVWALGLLSLPKLPLLLLQIVCGAGIYALLNLALKNESLTYVLSMLRQRRAAS